MLIKITYKNGAKEELHVLEINIKPEGDAIYIGDKKTAHLSNISEIEVYEE